MTWTQFKTAVNQMLTVDSGRSGIQNYITRMIKSGVSEVLSHVPYYRKGNKTRYSPLSSTPSGMTALTAAGNASKGTLPSGDANLYEAWVINYSATSGVTNTSSDTDTNRTPVMNYPYAHKLDLVSSNPAIRKGETVMAIGEELDFYVYPKLSDTQVLEITYEKLIPDHADGDTVRYDDNMADCVGEYVKAKVTREVDQDLKLYQSYMQSFGKMRQELYLNSYGKDRIETTASGPTLLTTCETETTTC